MTEQAKTHINHIDIEMDRDTLAILITVFEKMIEDVDMIDFEQMDLPDFQRLEILTQKLKKHCSQQELKSIRLEYNDWRTLSSYIWHADDILITDLERKTIDQLCLKCTKLREQGITPTSP